MPRPTALRLTPMRPRSPDEPGRVASSLELFFDLVFVIAVSTAGSELHHALASGHVAAGLTSYAMVFFAIWWAWMNFTWFATSFGTDDWLYRVLTIVQMGGVMVLAAGIPGLFGGASGEGPTSAVAILGYVIMRVAMVAQWLRAGAANPQYARTTRIYAIGIIIVQILWLVTLVVPRPVFAPMFVALALAELAVPVLAERIGRQTPWHPHHITERYGLFTLIVLGESLLASANAIISTLGTEPATGQLIALAALSLLVTAGLWWIYFYPAHHRAIGSFSQSLRFGYGHVLVLAAASAFSVGIELRIDRLLGESELGPIATNLAVSLPVAVFVLVIWALSVRLSAPPAVNVVLPVGALLILADAFVPTDFAWTTIIIVLMVVALVRWPARERDEEHAAT